MGCVSSTQVQPLDSTSDQAKHLTHQPREQEPTLVDQPSVKPQEIKQSNVDHSQSKKPKNISHKPKEPNFDLVDQHAIEAPEYVKKSIEKLVEYLIQPTECETEKVRAFYKWITENIRYDTESFFSGNYKPTDSRSVLQLGSSVCGGYANLFEEMCKQAGIEVKNISGFAKGYGHSAENTFTTRTKTNHAWNAVKIDGKWHFIECTWGAGNLNRNGEFQKSYTDFYFFTDPEHFISAHFPYMDNDIDKSSELQLLKTPITLDEYNKNIKLTEHAMKWNIVPKSHKHGIMQIKDAVDITLEDPMERVLDSSVHFYEKSSRILINEFTFIRKETANELKITVKPPSPGTYVLEVYTKIDPQKSNLEMMLEYILKSSFSSNNKPYPNHIGLWGMKQAAFDNGFQHDNKFRIPILQETKSGVVQLRLGTNRRIPSLVRLISAQEKLDIGKRYCLIESGTNCLIFKIKPPKIDYYKLEIMSIVKGASDDHYHQMATFLINCREPAIPCIPFPTTYPTTQEFGCVLIEPLSGQLPANTSVTCRFKSSTVKRALLHKQKMEQNGDEWFSTVTTPDVGIEFKIMANNIDENWYWDLYEYSIV